MSDLIDTTEMYLRIIFELIEEGIVPLRARIVERLEQSGPTVSETVARMERDGLLTINRERQIELTSEGYRRAVEVMRKHRLAERFLVDVVGLDLSLVHAEACRWEHVISDVVAARLAALSSTTEMSPYGNPIPQVGQGPEEVRQAYRLDSLPLSECQVDADYRLLRISEWVQAQEEVLELLLAAGLTPGGKFRWLSRSFVAVGDIIYRIPAGLASGLYVLKG